jgi:hypothetical protein
MPIDWNNAARAEIPVSWHVCIYDKSKVVLIWAYGHHEFPLVGTLVYT